MLHPSLLALAAAGVFALHGAHAAQLIAIGQLSASAAGPNADLVTGAPILIGLGVIGRFARRRRGA